MTIIERIYKVIQWTGLSVNAFEKKCSIGNGYLAKMKASSGTPGSDVISKIVMAFPDVRVAWLVMETGEMIAPAPKENENIPNDLVEPYNQLKHLQEKVSLLNDLLETKNKLIDAQEKLLQKDELQNLKQTEGSKVS